MMSDVEEEHLVAIDDELLIALVQTNPCLYAKSDKDFKDVKRKEMIWEVIAETLNCTSCEAKKRWESLRNQFCRKVRQHKNQPSGSGTSSEWPLMSCMSFLTSHIHNRKTRGSSLQKSSSERSETEVSSCSKNSIVPPIAQLQRGISSTDSESSAWPTEYNTSLDTEYLNTDVENTTNELVEDATENKNSENTLETHKTRTKRLFVPPLDNFAKKKKVTNNRLEDLLSKSSKAVSELATVFKREKLEEREKKENCDPNAAVMAQALKSVAPENQMSCLIAVLQVIESFQR